MSDSCHHGVIPALSLVLETPSAPFRFPNSRDNPCVSILLDHRRGRLASARWPRHGAQVVLGCYF
jgi:hypothetical protein